MEATRPDDVPDEPMRSRFLFYKGKPRTLTEQVRYVDGTHRAYRVLFSVDGAEEVFSEAQWKRELLSDRIQRIPGDRRLEDLSDLIGKVHTPQEALQEALEYLRVRSEHEDTFRTLDLYPGHTDEAIGVVSS